MTRVLFHYQATPELARRLRELCAQGLDVRVVEPDDRFGLARELPDVEILWHVLAPVDASFIAAARKLRFIQKWGVGVNTIDLAAARARGVRVANMPGTNARAVAELTLLLMLATLRRLSTIEASLRAGRWTPDSSILAVQRELAGRKVGLVGMGAVPSLLAPVLTAMGALPRYWNRTERPAAGIPYLPLTELITTSDVLSLHLPLAADTNRIVDVWAMKSGSILINTARGGLVDEEGLVEALRSGHLAGAGLDVFDVEPLAADHPLRQLPNVTITPHLAWLTAETLNRSLEVAVRNVGNLASGSDLDFEVF